MCPQLTLRLCPPCHTLRASHGTPCGTLQHAFFGWTRAASWKRQTYAAPARLLVLLSLRGDWRADFAGGGLAPAELPIRALVHPKRRPGARCVEQRVGGEDGRPGLLARAAGRNPAGDAGLFCAHTDLLGQPALAQAAIESIQAGGDVQSVVLRCYLEMSQVLGQQRGIERAPAMTPREFARHLAASGVRDEHIQQLTRLFEGARYGAQPPSASDERAAVECLTAIVQAYGGAA